MNRKEITKHFVPMLKCNQSALTAFCQLVQNESAPDDEVYAFCVGAVDSLYVMRQISSNVWKDTSKFLKNINWEWYDMIRECRSEEALVDAREMFYITEQIRAMRESEES